MMLVSAPPFVFATRTTKSSKMMRWLPDFASGLSTLVLLYAHPKHCGRKAAEQLW
jgi:hypothetical protein